MKLKKILSLVLSSVLLLGVFTGCSSSDDGTSGNDTTTGSIQEIKDRGVLKVGVFGDKYPFGYVDENDKSQGFDVYIAKKFAKDLLGDEDAIEFVLLEAASRVDALKSNKVDIVMANFTVTDERKEQVDFANPYMKVTLGIVSPDGDLITDVDQLEGQKLIVNKGTTAEDYFRKNYPDIELLKYDQNTECFEALKDGRGAALAHDNTEVLAWATENDGFTVAIPTLGSLDAIAPAVKKGNTELLDWINEELEKLAEVEFIHEAYNETLLAVYGTQIDIDDIVVEGGKID